MAEPSFFADVRAALGKPTAAPATTYSPQQFTGDIPAYAAAALTAETMNVAAAPAGTRNDTLNIAAVKLGSLVAGGHLPPALVLQELTAAATAAGLEAAEIRATLNSGLRKGEQTPREIPDTDKETEQWLNDVTTGQAPRAGSANGSTPAPPPRTGAPGPQNGTQPPAPSPSTTPGPWEEQTANGSAGSWQTAAPSSYTALPWEKSPQQTPTPTTAHAPTAGSTEQPTGPTAATGITNTGPAPSGPTATADALQAPPGILARETAMELLRLQSRAAAQRMFQQQNGAPMARPRAESLTALLAQEDEPVQYRIGGLLPAGGRVLLAAQYKAGKTTMVANMVKSLADGDPFLGMYRAEPSQRITIIDDEMSKGQIRRWYRDHEIRNTDSIKIVSLRGALSTFDILDPVTRQGWAAELHGTEILILDCLRPVLDALGLDENKDGGKFLVAFDALLAETGASEAVVVHHMGHGGNRSRGDSRILDWPDATWNVTREDVEDSKSPRYFSAHGRDVDEAERLLEYDESDGRALRIVGGDRRQTGQETIMHRIIDLISVQPHLTGRAIQTALGGKKKNNDEALARALREGHIVRYTGPRNAYQYTLKNSALPVIPSETQ